MDIVDADRLRQVLADHAEAAGLTAAHLGEFVREGTQAHPDVVAALEAAVAEGIVIGLQRALSVLEELRDD